jgi:hypothetical protein
VLSERNLRVASKKYVTVFANRSTEAVFVLTTN